ncbi:MAG: hypothetical protein AABX34_04530 [Nanoarchaeota archaeon]
MEAKKVEVEIVNNKKEAKKPLFPIFAKIKLTIAIILDLAHFFIGWIPLVNSAWSVVTFLSLLLILKNKKLAFLSLIEVPLILPPFSIIGMLIPIATITVLIDNSIGEIKIHKFRF